MNEKEKFYETIKKFFDEGIFREIYSTEEFAIFNVSNCSYLAFDYGISNRMKTPYGFNLDEAYLEPIMQDNSSFYRWIDGMDKHELKNNVVNCTSKMLEIMKLYKQKTDLNGPITNLDLEKSLIEKYGKQKNR